MRRLRAPEDIIQATFRKVQILNAALAAAASSVLGMSK